MKKNQKTKEQLLAENEDLRGRLEEAEETLRAIQKGEVDALVLSKPEGEAVFTLKGAEYPYRVFVEAINEGAATLGPEGTILYCNNRFAEMLNVPPEKVIGSLIHPFIPSEETSVFESAFQGGKHGNTSAEISFKREDQGLVPVHLSFNLLHEQAMPVVCLVAMDLTEPKRLEEALRQINADLENRIKERTANLRKVNKELVAEIIERKKVEELLRTSEERFRLAISATHAMIYDWDVRSARVNLMQGVASLLGFDPDENDLTLQWWDRQIHPDDIEGCHTTLQRMHLAPHDHVLEYRVLQKDGRVLWVEDHATPVCDESGELVRIVGTVVDITERKQAEEALRESEERLALAAGGAGIGFFYREIDKREVKATEQNVRLVGLPLATTATTTTALSQSYNFSDWAGRVHPEDLQRINAEMDRCLAEHKPLDYEYRVVWPDGSVHWLASRGIFLSDVQGGPTRLLGINMDITELKRAEEERDRLHIEADNERRRLEAVMDALPVGVAITDAQGGNIRSNRAFEKIWGSPRPSTSSIDDYSAYKAWWADTGKPVVPEDWASAQAVRKCEPVTQQVMKIQRFDGSQAFVINSGAPFFDEMGAIAGCAVAIQDITALREAQEALRESEERFKLLSETAGQLLTANDPLEKINELCRKVMEHLDCQVFFNFLAHEESGKLHLNACAGITEEEVRKIEWLDYGVAVCGCVARDGVRIVAEHIGLTPDPRTDLVHSYGVQAYACHPIRALGRLIGTLSFGAKTRTEFSPEDLALMKTVTDQVSAAMERFGLFKELQISRDELEMRVRERTAELELLNQALKMENELRLESEIELRESENRLRHLSGELLNVQEKERRLVAQDLHDSIGSALSAIKFKVEAARSQIGSNDLPPENALEGVVPVIQAAIQETRRIQKALRPPVLDELGILASIRWFCREYESIYSAIRTCQEIDIEEEDVPDSLKIVIFRILQEGLNNIAKYSGAELARVSLRKTSGRIELVLEDNGQGFDLKEALGSENTERGLGLLSMRERTDLSGGSFFIDSVRGKGTVIRAVWPV